MAFGCKLSLARWQKSFLASLQQLSPFTGPALISGLEGGMFIKLQAKDCVGICCCWVCLSPFCSRAGFRLVALRFLWCPHPPPAFLFNTYVVAEGKYHMILGQAFQFHCIFMGQAESQHLELLG